MYARCAHCLLGISFSVFADTAVPLRSQNGQVFVVSHLCLSKTIKQLYCLSSPVHAVASPTPAQLKVAFATADALALAGVDYLVVNEKIVDALDKATTLQGYNDGYRAGDDADDESVPQQLSAEMAQQTDFSESETTEVTRQLFEEGLGMAGLELLDNGIKSLVQDVERLEPAFRNLAIDSL